MESDEISEDEASLQPYLQTWKELLLGNLFIQEILKLQKL